MEHIKKGSRKKLTESNFYQEERAGAVLQDLWEDRLKGLREAITVSPKHGNTGS